MASNRAHLSFLDRAVELGRKGCGRTRPNPPVGAVLVKRGRIVGQGWHRKAGGPHAEVHALKDAGTEAKGATLYVSLEPCSTDGRTGACTEAISNAGIRQVVYGAKDPNPANKGKADRVLRKAGVECSHLKHQPSGDLIAHFSKLQTSGRPFVTLKLAMTLDGCIADKTGRSKWITGASARKMVQELRRTADGILVGSGTVLADNPSLTQRGGGAQNAWRIVADSRGRISPAATILTDRYAARTLIATTEVAASRWRAECSTNGAHIVPVRTRNGKVSLKSLMNECGKREMMHILCEGGGELAAALLKQGLVDELALFYAPRILGGAECLRAFPDGTDRLASAYGFEMIEQKQVGTDLFIRARPVQA